MNRATEGLAAMVAEQPAHHGRAAVDPVPPLTPDLPMIVVQRGSRDLVVRQPGIVRRVFNVVRFVPLLMALVMLGGVIGLYFQPPGVRLVMGWLGLQPGAGTSNPIAVPAPPRPASGPAVVARPVVVGLGKLVPDGEVVTIAPPFGAGDARIARLAVREGEQVEAGALLAVLDNERPLLAALESARATIAAREAGLAQSRASILASRGETEAALARAEATAANAARELERVEQLRQTGFAADTTYQLRRTARDESAREVERLKATLSRFAGDIGAQPDVVVAARTLASARADLERAVADLDKAQVRAPRAATVLTIHVQPGEKPGALGIMNLGNIAQMKADVEVYQTQIGLVAPGDPVEITAEALPTPLRGTISRIGLEVGRQSLVDATPAANTDARVVKVTVALDEASSAAASRFTNLQVIARIQVGRQP